MNDAPLSSIQSMGSQHAVPAARIEGLVTTEAGDEILVYDQTKHHIHHLNQTSAVIWRLCDGQRGVSDVARAASEMLGVPVSEELVVIATGKLSEAGLLDGGYEADAGAPKHSRRTMIRRAAIGGAAVAIPAIISITAPEAALAATCTGSCSCNSDCNGPCSQCSSFTHTCCNPNAGGAPFAKCPVGDTGIPC